MNIIDKLGNGIAQSIDTIIDKNRQYAQLNRLNAVIRNETESLNRAYIALGKQYYKILEGNAEEADMSAVCAVIESSKLRLKKAQARYEYIQKHGISGMEKKPPVVKIEPEENIDLDIEADDECDEDEDITIAYAENIQNTDKKTEQAKNDDVLDASSDLSTDDSQTKTEQQVSDTADDLKKKKSTGYAKKKNTDNSDSEAANDSEPVV